jgi:hypothetical protein
MELVHCNPFVPYRKSKFKLHERYFNAGGIPHIRPYVNGVPAMNEQELEKVIGELEIVDADKVVYDTWKPDPNCR